MPRRWPVRALAATVASAALVLAGIGAPAMAAPTSHEITASWPAGVTTAPYGEAVSAQWLINTNDVDDPYANDEVDNVRATIVAVDGVFTSIPGLCKTAGVAPVSEVSADGSTLLCNIGTVLEGTATLIQTPVRASGLEGGPLTLTGTVTSDTATAPAGPANPGPLPITYAHGMDLTLVSAPGSTYQGGIQPSRFGDERPIVKVNFSLVLAAGSRPGPASYSFPLAVGSSVPAALTGLEWEGCVPLDISASSTGQPFSDPAQSDRSNFPGCTLTGSGANYMVSLSNLDYTLVNTPERDSLGQPLAGMGAYIASGTLLFSIPSPVTLETNFAFTASPGDFTFDDGVIAPDGNAGNNATDTTLFPPGGFGALWLGSPALSRSPSDTNLWVSPGTSYGVQLPQPGIDDWNDFEAAVANGTLSRLPLYMQVGSGLWSGYQGPGGAQLAGICVMNQNPVFVPTSVEGAGWYLAERETTTYQTARFFYTTQVLDTKTETCGQAAPSAMWTEVVPPVGNVATDPRISNDILMQLPAGVTGVKMTWDPAVDRTNGGTFLRVFGHIDPNAPTSGEGWTVGTFTAPQDPAVAWPGYPTLNNWVNISTRPGGPDLPDSTYGPNLNGVRDAFRLQGPDGIITKEVSATTAQPGIPLTYTLEAQARNTVTSPPPVSFSVVDTLPAGLEYVPGSATPAPSSVAGQTLTWQFTGVQPNVSQTITYQAQLPADAEVPPGTALTNTAVVNVPGDNRPADHPDRTARATVLVPNTSSTSLGKSAEDNILSFFGDNSAWQLTINSQDPEVSEFTDTIDVLPQVGDGRGTDIDGSYAITGVTAPPGSTVYYTSAPFASVSADPRDISNGGTPGSIVGNTVGWSTTAIPNPTAIRVIGPALAPGATQSIRIAFDTPSAESCEDPAAGDNKPGQILVNSATSIAGHTELPMLSSATTTIGSCYAVDLKKYVQDADGVWHDADDLADFPVYHVGDTVPYRIVVENVGQGTVTGLEVTDALIPAGSFVVGSLARGETETHEFEYLVPAGSSDQFVNTACAAADTPTDGEAPVIPCDPAGIRVVGDPEHEKSLISATPIGGGQWEIVYGIEVTNTSTSATSYSLDDVLHFTDQASILSAAVTASPAGVVLDSPAWDGQTATGIATGVPLPGSDDAGYAPHQYQVTVIADVPLELEGAGSADDPSRCGADGDDADTAFNNVSALTDSAGEVEEDQACAPISSIDIGKSVSSGPTDNGDGTWTVVYDIVATNDGGAAGLYDVTDRMTLDGDFVLDSAEVITVPSGVSSSATWTGVGAEGSPDNVIASGVSLPADTVHTYQVEVVFSIGSEDGVPVVTVCPAPGDPGGLSNSAGIEHNDLEDAAEACITVAFITVDKTVSSGPTPNGDGTWTVVYDIVAENIGAATGEYDVTDRLHFGEGIDIVSTNVSTTPSGVTAEAGWTGLGSTPSSAENLIASDVALAAGGTHTYQVEVVVDLDENTVDPTVLQCPPAGTTESGGLANSTSLTHNGIVAVDGVCPTLPFIDIDKSISAGPTPNGDGTWTITYDLVASNPGAAAGEYDLVDRLGFGAGIVIESADVVTTPVGVPDPSAWTGQGADGDIVNDIASDVTLDASESHTYQVQVIVSLGAETVTPESLRCPAPGSSGSGGLSNTAGLTHNGETRDSEACALLPLIETEKSLFGAALPVAGQPGQYDVAYEVTVTNSGPGAGQYDLDDRLAPGAGIAIVGIQSVTSDAADPVVINPDFDGVGDPRIVTAQPIAASMGTPVVHTYIITVRYSADLAGIDVPAGNECATANGTVDGALNNVATGTWNGIESEADECLRPGKPTLDKSLVSATPIGNGQWEVVYDLVVGNVGAEPTSYDLDDELLFATEVSVDSVAVTGPAGVTIEGSFNGGSETRITTDATIPGMDEAGYAPHVYTVTVVADVPLQFGEVADDGTGSPVCTGPSGDNLIHQGLNNSAMLADDTGGTTVDTDCAGLPEIEVDKTITAGPVVSGAQYTTTYQIVVSNTGAAPGDYVLRDQLRYGAGMTVLGVTASNLAPGTVPVLDTFTGAGDTLMDAVNAITGDVTLAAGERNTFRVVVVSTLEPSAMTSGSGDCADDGDTAGGLLNSAALEHNGLAGDAGACAPFQPPQPPLGFTGTNPSGMAGLAAMLLLLGLLVMIARRREEAGDA